MSFCKLEVYLVPGYYSLACRRITISPGESCDEVTIGIELTKCLWFLEFLTYSRYHCCFFFSAILAKLSNETVYRVKLRKYIKSIS